MYVVGLEYAGKGLRGCHTTTGALRDPAWKEHNSNRYQSAYYLRGYWIEYPRRNQQGIFHSTGSLSPGFLNGIHAYERNVCELG